MSSAMRRGVWWRPDRVSWWMGLLFAVGSLCFAVAAIVSQWASAPRPAIGVTYFVGSILFTAATGYFLARPPVTSGVHAPSGSASSDMAAWVVALFAVGTVAATVFGLAALIPAGAFGSAVGYSGTDDFVYRQGGAATLGAAVGGALVLTSRLWESARIPALMAITFNALSAVAAALDIASGGPPIGGLILLAAVVVTIGMSAAVARGGR